MTTQVYRIENTGSEGSVTVEVALTETELSTWIRFAETLNRNVVENFAPTITIRKKRIEMVEEVSWDAVVIP